MPFCNNAKSYQYVLFIHLDDQLDLHGFSGERLKSRYNVTFGKSLSNEHIGLLEKIINDNLNNHWRRIRKEDAGVLESLQLVDNNEVDLVLDGYREDHEFLVCILDELNFEFLEEDDENVREEINIYAPSAHYRNFMEQYEVMNIGDLTGENIEEINIQLQSRFIGKTIDELREENPLTPESEALMTALDAFYEPRELSQATAQDVLMRFPSCVEAYICLAGWEDETQKRIE